jgi:hypothetical protein
LEIHPPTKPVLQRFSDSPLHDHDKAYELQALLLRLQEEDFRKVTNLSRDCQKVKPVSEALGAQKAGLTESVRRYPQDAPRQNGD